MFCFSPLAPQGLLTGSKLQGSDEDARALVDLLAPDGMALAFRGEGQRCKDTHDFTGFRPIDKGFGVWI